MGTNLISLEQLQQIQLIQPQIQLKNTSTTIQIQLVPTNIIIPYQIQQENFTNTTNSHRIQV
jgi:hypothetical protein